jgi:hypothetical protein
MYNNLQISYGQSPSLQPQVVAGATSETEGGGPNIPNGKINKNWNTNYSFITLLVLFFLSRYVSCINTIILMIQ